ncbi:phosphate ABC transporter substrate-binding protein PstS [Scytonema sp. NUACC21]
MIVRSRGINPSRLTRTVSVLALSISLAACGGGGDQQAQTGTNSGETASTGTATNTTATSPAKLDLGGNVSLTGAGASFPAPLYTAWFQALNQKYPNLQINYQSTGSGAGVEQFIKGTVDFGASDVAMKDEEIKKVDRGVLLLPVTAGSIVLAYNVPGVDQQLKLPRDVYIGILQGNIKTWNDPKITAANPGINLPNTLITVVYRSDGSGTTGVFTKHLSAVSPDWKSKVGEGKTVSWPVGVGAKGNEGVTAQIQQTQGAIGYVEYGYAKQNGLKYAALQNKAGQFVAPTEESASKTLEAVALPDNLRAFIADPDGNESYPIVTYTWILAYQKYPEAAKAKAVEAMVEYALTEGQKLAPELGYVPLPQTVVQKVAAAADAISPDYKIATGGASGTAGASASK